MDKELYESNGKKCQSEDEFASKPKTNWEDVIKHCDKFKSREEAEAIRKYKDTMKYTNQMLEECKTKNYQKNSLEKAQEIGKEIDRMIEGNKQECKKYDVKPSLKKYMLPTECKQTSNFMNPFDNVDFSDYNHNNRFLVTFESGLFSAQPVNIRSFWQDDQYRLKITMLEQIDQCLPMLLDTSIENAVNYKVTKSILNPDGETAYSVVYTGCKVIDYTESALDYNNIDLRTFTITMDYKDYTYDV